ncbi:uncharacterized protein LOC112517157 isoform X2 [Cynara cardunculus var. scolymus]|uniref:uncharacterized protein LOC112517157 isoform X2 n=1 Tax=Cynara cardunculus var. scolymus TaxID=59895 RepID=UPI000D6311AB|nr:uncharacterized protein LOC112517157 isoform X2 [Cynara cardunculus var. scolymus]
MSKIMKGIAYESSSHVSYEDVRARFKHQTLLQDYLELQQETEAARNKLEAMKQKKQTLEAEVRKNKKEKVYPKKSATFPNLPPIHNLNQRGRGYTEKKNMVPSRPVPVYDLDQRVNLHGVNLNQEVVGNNLSLVNEFNQKEVVVQARAPIFDLNQISMEEEDVQEGYEEQRKEQHNDLKLSMCRNVGDGSTSRSGKRKISWQDPVALRV